MFSKKKAPPQYLYFQPPFKPSPPPPPKKKLTPPLLLFLIFCICLWALIESVSPHQPDSTQPPRFYSNQTQQDLRLTLVDAIRKAKSSIHLVMFGLSDPAIMAALSRKEIPLTVYYDPSASPNLFSSLSNAELHPVRGHGLMHQKILILDKETIFLGSANMTTASLTMHDNLVIGLDRKSVV